MACIVASLVPDPYQLSIISLDRGRGIQVHNTPTMTIFSERGMFSAFFNAKTNVLRRTVWFLFYMLVKKQCTQDGNVVRVEKINSETKQTFALNFAFSVKRRTNRRSCY